jgi:flagellum-specific ATP synthase
MPLAETHGIHPGSEVVALGHPLEVPVGPDLLGRVLNGLGEPIDALPPVKPVFRAPCMAPPPHPLQRRRIREVFGTGIKALDTLIPVGRGQRLGIFAGSGVGKSTLLGMMAAQAEADVNVIALIGERGREVREFLEKDLSEEGRAKSVIVVATSNEPALTRLKGAYSAMAIAEYFRDQGKSVLLMMDSVTRFAMAQREIGLALGEPPTSKGYPPSSLTLLPQLMERAGKEEGHGSITAFFTVLVEGDDMSDPIADQSRSILDGHIVLSREMTDFGIYPPIHILNSASRVMNDIVSTEHLAAIRRFRRLYTLLKENEMLIRIGAYVRGTDKELDEAISKKEAMEAFLSQEAMISSGFNESVDQLIELMK